MTSNLYILSGDFVFILLFISGGLTFFYSINLLYYIYFSEIIYTNDIFFYKQNKKYYKYIEFYNKRSIKSIFKIST